MTPEPIRLTERGEEVRIPVLPRPAVPPSWPDPDASPEPDPVEAARARLRQRAGQIRDVDHRALGGAVQAVSPVLSPLAEVAPRQAEVIRRPEPVTGARLLEMVSGYLRYYAGWPSDAVADAVTLWAAHSVARGEDGSLIWPASPRLLLTSEQNGSGKSTVLDLLGYLARSQFGRLPKITAAAFAALMGQESEIGLIDEARLVCGTGARSAEIQALLLAGYTQGAHALVMRGGKPAATLVYGPVAYAGKTDMLDQPDNSALTDLLARSIRITMARPPKHYPEAGPVAREQGNMLGSALTTWTASNAGSLAAEVTRLAAEDAGTDVDPNCGGSLRGRQIWRPLLAIATLAGGPWSDRARAARDELSGTVQQEQLVMPDAGDLEALAAMWEAGR